MITSSLYSVTSSQRLIVASYRWILLIIAITATGLACNEAALTPKEPSDPAPTAMYNFNMTIYQGHDALGANTISIADLQGQPVVLNFWAGLCPPCRAEMPEFQRFADEYAGQALVIGVDLGQFFSLGGPADAQTLLDDLMISYPTGYTTDANVTREWQVLGLPATYFINADGSLHRKWQGVLTGDKLAEITDEMIPR